MGLACGAKKLISYVMISDIAVIWLLITDITDVSGMAADH
jgi:hypothetical protein